MRVCVRAHANISQCMYPAYRHVLCSVIHQVHKHLSYLGCELTGASRHDGDTVGRVDV